MTESDGNDTEEAAHAGTVHIYYMIKTLLVKRWSVTALSADECVTEQQYRYLDM